MKINRTEHPILTVRDFNDFVSQLTELEMGSLKESLNEDENFEKLKNPISKSDIRDIIRDSDRALRDAKDAVIEIELLKDELEKWLEKLK